MEYKRMTKVRVLLDRLDVDVFQKTGKITFLNKKGLDNVRKPKHGEILGTRRKTDNSKGKNINTLAVDTANNIRITRAQKRKREELLVANRQLKSKNADDNTLNRENLDELGRKKKDTLIPVSIDNIRITRALKRKHEKLLATKEPTKMDNANDNTYNRENPDKLGRKKKYTLVPVATENIHITRAQKHKHKELLATDEPKKLTNANDNKRKTTTQKRNKSRKENGLLLKEKMANEAPQKSYLLHEIVLVTIPGFVAWPARIKKIMGETIFIEFFGTGQINPVRSMAIMRFDIGKVIPLLSRRGYRKAMHEVELLLRIPPEESILSN